MKSSLRRRLVFALFASFVAAVAQVRAQTPPPEEEKPFIEPAEHQHGVHARAALAIAPDVNLTGRWATLPVMMPINPVHVALMRNGRVLVVSGSGNDPNNDHLAAGVYDPVSETIDTFTITWDMFCNGMIVLPDGRPFVLGGTLSYDVDKKHGFFGEPRTALFDPTAGTFTNGPSMGNGRWYPTGTVLADGKVMVISGLGTNGGINSLVQVYDPATNTFANAGAAFSPMPLYPRQSLLPDGKVFESGANVKSQMWDPATKKFTFVASTNYPQKRDYGTALLLPLTPANGFKPKVMILGGGEGGKNVTATTETIDLSVASPQWEFGKDMNAPRIQLNATILPNGKVIVSGGSTNDEDPKSAVLAAQLYDPATNTFAAGGTMEFPRLYHSNTILLPDATVLAVGGNPERTIYEPAIEVYSPPYLFKADGSPATRPVISSITTNLTYGGRFTINTPDAANIREVVMIRPGGVTHAFDMEQRLVGVTFTYAARVLTATAPASGRLAPPGWYLVFILNGNGVPSVGRFVRIG